MCLKKASCLLVCVVVVLNATARTEPSLPPRYNVLFIISDDMRAEPGSFGGLARTPNIDALAASGVRFERA